MIIPPHISWLTKTGRTLKTSDGKEVEIYAFSHKDEALVIKAWAKHFREHYCRDSEIDNLRNGTGLSRSEFLMQRKFPDKTNHPGPIVRSGDFGEILVADFLEFSLNYIVPRTRYEFKEIRNESAKGVDVIGFKFKNKSKSESPNDELITFEVKCSLVTISDDTLTKALADSKKDFTIRKSEALNAMKQRLKFQGNNSAVPMVERFQNKGDHPYREISGAGAIHSSNTWSDSVVTSSSTIGHPNRTRIFLIAIIGDDMMNLVHKLYQTAANEA